MATRTITGNLAADSEVVQAGSIKITKFRVLENTGEYRRSEYLEHDTPTVHFVEAKFELGENAAASPHRGDAVIVVGREHTSSWGPDDAKQYEPRHRGRQHRAEPHASRRPGAANRPGRRRMMSKGPPAARPLSSAEAAAQTSGH